MKLALRLIKDLMARYRSRLLLIFLLTAVIAAVPYGFSFLGKWLVDEALQVTGPPKEAADTSTEEEAGTSGPAAEGVSIEWKAKTTEEKLRLLLLFLIVSLGIHFVVTGLSVLSELFKNRMDNAMVYSLRTRLHEKLENADMEVFSREQVGQLMTRILDDAGAVPANLSNLVINTATQIAMLALGIVLLIRLNPLLALVAVAVLPFYTVTCVYFLPRIRKNTESIRNKVAALNGYVMERLTHVATVKNYAQEDREVQTFGGKVDEHLSYSRKNNRLNLFFGSLTTLVTGFGTLAVLALGFINIRAGRMQLGEVLAFYQVTAQLFVPISALVGMASVIQTLNVLGQRIYSVLDASVKISEKTAAGDLPEIKGRITFENVSMRYQEGGPFAVNAVSFEITPGSTVCLVGPTGCGKSTLITLLTRLYDPTEGVISLDGFDIRNLPVKSLRHTIGNVLHDCPVFSGTIHENIAYGSPDAENEKLEIAAKTVGLYEFIMNLEKGFKTRLGQGGIELPEEQLVELNLARALVTDPAVLTVDDTYSRIEEAAETRLRKAVREALKNRTIIIATSRLSICEDADCIVVLQRGKIMEKGTYRELLSSPGLFRRMYMRQMGIEKIDEVSGH